MKRMREALAVGRFSLIDVTLISHVQLSMCIFRRKEEMKCRGGKITITCGGFLARKAVK